VGGGGRGYNLIRKEVWGGGRRGIRQKFSFSSINAKLFQVTGGGSDWNGGRENQGKPREEEDMRRRR
jgi:hypothetical protein